ncbi:MAG TPA: hypothetical protein VMI31_15270, partial [Fimbriimonadaceae bacterium]|nr:hypothetical protein [Fimbriimonadaceae bacterium]
MIWAGIAVLGGGAALEYLNLAPQEAGLEWPLRRAQSLNTGVWERLFRSSADSPGFSPSQRTFARVNGGYGLGADFDPAKWTLKVDNSRGQA